MGKKFKGSRLPEGNHRDPGEKESALLADEEVLGSADALRRWMPRRVKISPWPVGD